MSQENDILMPKLGLTMTEGLLAEWIANVGDSLSEGDVMFIVETDKVATEITAPSSGTLLERVVEVGITVPVGAVVGRWTGGVLSSEQVLEAELPSANSATDLTAPSHSSSKFSVESNDAINHKTGNRLRTTPLARKLATQSGLDLSGVIGSGPNGRIKAADVRSMLSSNKSIAHNEELVPDFPARPAELKNDHSSGKFEIVSGLVQTMARRMVEAKQNIPHFYLSTEAEVSELLLLRQRMNEDSQAPKVTLNHFLIVALVRALQLCPWQNRVWHQQGILSFDTIDLGLAVTTDKGLVAPVLRDLGSLAFDHIVEQSSELINRVRDGKTTYQDFVGGALTLSNAGMFNVTYVTPIINPPQSAILGAGSVREVFRPDQNGSPVLRHELGLVLSCDHRLHDGHSGLKFLNTVVDLLENPLRLLRA